MIDPTLEQKNHVKDSKILEEAREANIDLKTQLEEAKRIEEALRDQLEEKEVTNQKHEFEIVNLRKKIEKSKHHEKFNSSSVMLDKLLDCQRSPFDKSGLGFRKVENNLEEDKWSPKTPNAGPSMTKDASYVPTNDNKDGECSRTHQEVDLIPQKANIQLQEGNKVQGMNMNLMATVFLAQTLATRQ